LGVDSPNIEYRSKFEYDGMSKQKVMHIPAILKWSLPWHVWTLWRLWLSNEFHRQFVWFQANLAWPFQILWAAFPLGRRAVLNSSWEPRIPIQQWRSVVCHRPRCFQGGLEVQEESRAPSTGGWTDRATNRVTFPSQSRAWIGPWTTLRGCLNPLSKLSNDCKHCVYRGHIRGVGDQRGLLRTKIACRSFLGNERTIAGFYRGGIQKAAW